jgi:hypothetical protein
MAGVVLGSGLFMPPVSENIPSRQFANKERSYSYRGKIFGLEPNFDPK